jgi:hypothetical protein
MCQTCDMGPHPMTRRGKASISNGHLAEWSIGVDCPSAMLCAGQLTLKRAIKEPNDRPNS